MLYRKLFRHLWTLKYLPEHRATPKPGCCFCRISHSGSSSMQNACSDAWNGFGHGICLTLSLKCSLYSSARRDKIRELVASCFMKYLVQETQCCHEYTQIYFQCSETNYVAYSFLKVTYSLPQWRLFLSQIWHVTFIVRTRRGIRNTQEVRTKNYISLSYSPGV